MRVDELVGTVVVGAGAQVIGEVCDIQFDEKTMNLTGICIKLNENVLESMRMKKPRFGSVRVDVPIEVIKVIGDVVSLDKTAQDLGPIAKRR